jgi:hypothetical protein
MGWSLVKHKRYKFSKSKSTESTVTVSETWQQTGATLLARQ